MKSSTIKLLGVLILVVSVLAGIILTGTVLLAVTAIDVITDGVVLFFLLEALGAILQNLEEINYGITQLASRKPTDSPSASRSSAPAVKNVGSTWRCSECDTVNPLTVRVCKGCGKDK